jgi:hypothetical protein
MDIKKESKNVQKAFEKAQEMQTAGNGFKEFEEENSSTLKA